MSLVIGTVQCIQVSEDLGTTTIVINPTTKENLFLWSTGDRPVDVQVMHSNWVSLLRQAMASDLQVTIDVRPFTALVRSVQLGQS